MERCKLKCFEDLLSVAGLNPFLGHHDRSRSIMAAKPLKVLRERKPQYIYTTSQLIELFAKRGDVSVRIANREPVAFKAGDQSAVSVLLSTIGKNEVFKIVINTISGPNKSPVGDGYDITMNINVCEFIKLSANSLKSKSNLGPLFDEWNVPLFASQRRSMGLDLKKIMD